MQHGSAPETGSYPSRRSLRQASAASGAEGSSFPSRRSLRSAPAPEHPAPDEVLTALPTRISTAPAPSPDPPLPPARGRSLRRVLSTAAALACAAGLFVTMALPALGTSVSADEPAAALPHQELSQSAQALSGEDPLIVPGRVEAESTGAPVDFVNFRDAEVQFPFATGHTLTDGFGPRSYPVAGMHDAQDFAAPEGTTVQAIARGVVLETGPTTDGCGFGVLLAHVIDDLEVTSRYCHMQFDSNDLVVGQEVSVGQAIGRVGATGLAFGAHLHFVLTIDGEAVDPMPFLMKYNRLTRG